MRWSKERARIFPALVERPLFLGADIELLLGALGVWFAWICLVYGAGVRGLWLFANQVGAASVLYASAVLVTQKLGALRFQNLVRSQFQPRFLWPRKLDL